MNNMNFSGRDMVSLLLNEAKRKPAIAALVARISELSVEDIDAAEVPLPWFRIALKRLKEREYANEVSEHATGFANLMGGIENTPQIGTVLRYTGSEFDLIPVAKGSARSLTLRIKTGELLFLSGNETWAGSVPIGMPNLSCEVIETELPRNDYIWMLSNSTSSDGISNEAPREDLPFPIQFTRH